MVVGLMLGFSFSFVDEVLLCTVAVFAFIVFMCVVFFRVVKRVFSMLYIDNCVNLIVLDNFESLNWCSCVELSVRTNEFGRLLSE